METNVTPDKCPACNHEVGYHYEDGDGNVVCRFVSDCGCVEPHFGTIEVCKHGNGEDCADCAAIRAARSAPSGGAES